MPAEYFLITFTLPAELRPLAWANQKVIYDLLLRCAWETLHTFSRNDRQLQGTPGAIAVLHTSTRRLEYHPHAHFVVPAAALDAERKRWRTKRRRKRSGSAGGKVGSEGTGGYLFNQKALAKVFRAKMLAALDTAGLALPGRTPTQWVVDCKSVGSGTSAIIYLGRYLYRGVIQEKDIVACKDGQVTFRYRDAKTGRHEHRTVPGAQFLWLVLQHVLPKGFRRAQLRVSASELQAPDRALAGAAEVRSRSGGGLGQAASVDSVYLLRSGDEGRADANRGDDRRRTHRTTCRRRGVLIM